MLADCSVLKISFFSPFPWSLSPGSVSNGGTPYLFEVNYGDEKEHLYALPSQDRAQVQKWSPRLFALLPPPRFPVQKPSLSLCFLGVVKTMWDAAIGGQSLKIHGHCHSCQSQNRGSGALPRDCESHWHFLLMGASRVGRGDSSENCCLPFSPSGDAEENGVPATSSRQAQPESPRRLKSYELFLLLFISNPFNIQESTVRRGLIRTKGGCFQ